MIQRATLAAGGSTGGSAVCARNAVRTNSGSALGTPSAMPSGHVSPDACDCARLRRTADEGGADSGRLAAGREAQQLMASPLGRAVGTPTAQ
jgi:hypothetical protein